MVKLKMRVRDLIVRKEDLEKKDLSVGLMALAGLLFKLGLSRVGSRKGGL
jgi:hypothetical protein